MFGEQNQYDKYQANAMIGGVGGGTGAGVATRALSLYALKAAPSPSLAPPPASPGLVQAPVATPKSKNQIHGEPSTDALGAPKDAERRALESKLQPALLAALDCFRKSANGGASCKDVHSGKVAIMILFAENAPANAHAQLQALGFGFTKGPVAQNLVTGVLTLDKLDELAKLPFVKFVSFQRR